MPRLGGFYMEKVPRILVYANTAKRQVFALAGFESHLQWRPVLAREPVRPRLELHLKSVLEPSLVNPDCAAVDIAIAGWITVSEMSDYDLGNRCSPRWRREVTCIKRDRVLHISIDFV